MATRITAIMVTTVTMATVMAIITAMTMATLQCEAMLTVSRMEPKEPIKLMAIATEKATIITCISWVVVMTKAMPPTWRR